MYIVMDMNIYITKDNEEFLQKIRPDQSMSGIINKLLTDYRERKGYDFFPLGDKEDKPTLVIEEAPDVISALPRTMKLCKHGADPKFCRFARPGKPCK